MMTKLSDTLAIWTYKKNKTGVNFNANTWAWISSETIPGPVDLVNALGGSTDRQAGNPAVALQAAINDAGNVTMYYSNRSTNAITTNVYTNAIVFGTYK